MTHFMGFSMSADSRVVKQAKRIHTGKEHENVRVTLTRPMRRDIRPLPVGNLSLSHEGASYILRFEQL